MAIRWIVGICAAITFIIPLVQLSIGFKYVVKDGASANYECQAAPDLPLLMAIGGIFSLFFLGTAYGLFKMLSSKNDSQSDMSGNSPKILIGLVSLIFGAITLIFFILIQMRVYRAYSNGVQFTTQSAPNFCQSTIMRGALAMIILTYVNIILFIIIFVLLLIHVLKRVQEENKPTSP